jgi:transcriptional regulator with XRE-family HTH domain
MTTLGKNLQKLLADRGESQTSFAKRIGVHQSQVSNWVRGANSPTLQTLRKVKAALGCTWDELLGDGAD